MQQIPLTLHGLRDHQNQAIEYWRSTHDDSVPFQAWASIFQALQSSPADQKEAWLGHAAVLWQELNVACAGVEWLPLINQFIQIGFRGIAPKMPRDFAPALAPEAVAWHQAFLPRLPRLTEIGPSGQQVVREFDAMLFQYAVVFGRRAQKQNRTFLEAQLGHLTRARACLKSELLLASASAKTDDASVLPLVDLLAEAQMVGPSFSLSALVPEAVKNTGAELSIAQALLFWSERAPWFAQALKRLAPGLLPPKSARPTAKPDALPASVGCDQHVLLLGFGETRTWLLASEATCPIVTLESLAANVDQLREAWRSNSPLPAPIAAPELQAAVEPASLCRPVCWHIPAAYIHSHALGHVYGSVRAAPDAALVRLCDEVLAAQKPGCVIAVFDWKQMGSAGVKEAATAYGEVAKKLAGFMRNQHTRPDGVRWAVVFDNAPDPESMASAEVEARLLTEYTRTLRGLDGSNEPATFVNQGSRDLSPLLDLTQCKRSLAFFDRMQADLAAIGPLLDALKSLGFVELSVSYTRSAAGECSGWHSFSQLWSSVRTVLAANSQTARHNYLAKEWLKELSEHTAPRGSERGLGYRVPHILSELVNDGSGPNRHSEASLTALWTELYNSVGQESIVPAKYESLWASWEAGRKSQHESASARTSLIGHLMVALLEELGIPNLRLSEFGWTSELSGSTLTPLSPDDWSRLERLAGKQQPVLLEDEDLRALKPLHMDYDRVRGSTSYHCLLKDFGPEAMSAPVLYEHGQTELVSLLLNPNVNIDAKTRLLLSLRGYAPAPWRKSVSLTRGERDLLKFNTVHQLGRDVLLADIILVHLLRLCIKGGIALRASQVTGTTKWQFRRSQLLRLLEVGGFKSEVAAEHPDAVRVALRRVIDLWKEFYRNRSPHRAKQRASRVEALKLEYEQLCKPMAQPALHADLSILKAEELERHVYVAACTAELMARIPRPQASTAQAEGDSVAFDVDDFARRAKTLIEQYVGYKGRYMLRRAASMLEGAQWLRGFGPEFELVGRDALAAPQVDPAVHAQRIAAAVNGALRATAIPDATSFEVHLDL